MYVSHAKPERPPARPAGAQPAAADPLDPDPRFKHLLGAKAWARLPKAIRRRFSKHLQGDASLVYQGRVTEMRMNLAGRALAFALRLIGAPLPFDRTSVGRSAVVIVTEDAASGGQFWIRQYSRSSGFPQMVSSSKRFDGPTGLEEYIGYGIGIALRLESSDNALFFVSDHYFIKLGSRRLPLPKWLYPGQLVIGHEELGGGYFRFSLDLSHRFLGAVMRQDAVFQDADIVQRRVS